MKVMIDRALCQGHSRCVTIAPEVFVADEFGNADVALGGDVPESQVGAVQRAAANCPEQAISVDD